MKIESYATEMASTSVSTKSYSMKESVVVNAGNGALSDESGAFGDPSNRNGGAAVLALSPEAQTSSGAARNESVSIRSANAMQGIQLSDKDLLKLELLERMVEAITGRKLRFRRFHGFRVGSGAQNNPMPQVMNRAGQTQQAEGQTATMTVVKSAEYHEARQMTFQANGVVNTSDGRQIRFDLNVMASYEFSSSKVVSVQAAKLADPLIINFDGALPEFTKDRYAFDITIDGLADNIYMPTNGAGFLALDKDGNGKIDDGSELFGASTGNGFRELSAYDEDGNGWIDEGDSVFAMLQLMSVDKDTGETVLISLKDSGVGAIFLGSTTANYQIKGDDNELVGVVRNNGIFLNENGSVGTIHHIDLTY